MTKDYYVYEYYSEVDGEVALNDETIIINKGDVYYVGKGTGNRVKSGARNVDCEKFKNEVGWNYRIIKDKLTEEDALILESELIEEYRSNGIFLTNTLSGNIIRVNNHSIGITKYLINLVKSGCVIMSRDELTFETNTHSTFIWDMMQIMEGKKEDKYANILPKCPENIGYILDKYDSSKLNERDIKFGNIKYVLELMDFNVLKITQSDIAKEFNESATVVSSIKKEKYANEIKSIRPDNLTELLLKYDTGKFTESELKDGVILYIIEKLIESNVLRMTITDMIYELQDTYHGLTMNSVQEIKRRRDKVKLIKPDSSIISILFAKYYFDETVYDISEVS
jgi:hypothetical protein